MLGWAEDMALDTCTSILATTIASFQLLEYCMFMGYKKDLVNRFCIRLHHMQKVGQCIFGARSLI